MFDGAFSAAEVAWVFLEQRRIKEVAEELAGSLVGEGSAITLAVSGGALAVAGEFIGRLAQSGRAPAATKVKGSVICFAVK